MAFKYFKICYLIFVYLKPNIIQFIHEKCNYILERNFLRIVAKNKNSEN